MAREDIYIYIYRLAASFMGCSKVRKRGMAHWAVNFDKTLEEKSCLRFAPCPFPFPFGRSTETRHAMLVMPICIPASTTVPYTSMMRFSQKQAIRFAVYSFAKERRPRS
jgi:hypothetical protein